MDEDLAGKTKEELIDEVRRLRAGIRTHRDSTRHELCWHHPQLWNLLPEKTDPKIEVPEWPQFLKGCIRYRQSLDEQAPHVPRVSVEYRLKGDNTHDHNHSSTQNRDTGRVA